MNPTLEQHPSASLCPPKAPALGRIAIALVTGWDVAEVPVELPAELAEFEARLRIVRGPAGSRATSGGCRRPSASVRTARAGVHPC